MLSMKKELKYGVVGLLIGGVAVWGILAATGDAPTRGMMGLSTEILLITQIHSMPALLNK